ncbi:PDR/VanB family oxidoreductase [Telluria sp. B2]
MNMPSPLRVTVLARHSEAQDIVGLELGDAGGAPLPPFTAGAHIDVQLGPGLTRQYSLCNAPSERHRYLIAVLRDPRSRGGSRAIHDSVRVGDSLQISAPRNHFPLVQARRYLLFAGGIGVTPILCMAERLAQLEADFTMHYCTRAPERTAFRERLAGSCFANRVRFHFDAGTEPRLDIAAALDAATPDTHLYVCGPAGFIEAVTSAAGRQGWSGERVHVEHFGAAPAADAGAAPFEVKIASTGQVCRVGPGLSVTRALEEQGIVIPVSCEQGVCGTCVTRVLQGAIEHRDQYFTDEERALNDQFTPCCSREQGMLVLDL